MRAQPLRKKHDVVRKPLPEIAIAIEAEAEVVDR
jgi:hypothetical protein